MSDRDTDWRSDWAIAAVLIVALICLTVGVVMIEQAKAKSRPPVIEMEADNASE